MKSMFNCTHCSYSSNYKSNVIRHSNVKHQVRDGTDKLHKIKKIEKLCIPKLLKKIEKPCIPKLSKKIEKPCLPILSMKMKPFQFYTKQPKQGKDDVNQNKITEELVFSLLQKVLKNQMFLSIPLKTYLSKAKQNMNKTSKQ